MNNTFNLQRFGLLLKRQWLEFGKIYLISVLVALGIIITFYGFSLVPIFNLKETFSGRQLGFRDPLFLILGFLFISVIASSYFAQLGQKPKAIIELMIPASTFEKFLAGIFFTAVVSTASFLLVFYLTDLAFVAKLRSIVTSSTVVTYTDVSGHVKDTTDNAAYFFASHKRDIFAFAYVIPFFITSIFLLGSIYFNKFHYIKTAIAVMIFSGIWTYIVMNTVEYLMKGRVPVERAQFNNNGEQAALLWLAILLSLLTIIFWAITYVRLKEKEV